MKGSLGGGCDTAERKTMERLGKVRWGVRRMYDGEDAVLASVTRDQR